MDKKNCGDYEVTCSSCGRPWAVCKEKGGCSKCGDVRFCEYGRKASGCIREKQPGCPMQAVIPSVTVDTVNGIKGLSDCLVHVADINTTYYIDDQHRLLTTWGGPVSVYDYDFDDNPLNLRNQMAYDTANNILAIYDKSGIAYKIPISNLDNDYNVMVNKPQINGYELVGNKTGDELGLQDKLTAGDNIQIEGNTISATDTTYTAGNGIELDGTEIKAKIGDGLEFDNDGEIDIAGIEQYAHFFDTVADMQSADLPDNSFAVTAGYYSANDGGAGAYKIISSGAPADGGSIIALDSGLKAQLIINGRVNVKQFGAKGDNSANDTTAIQSAINFAKSKVIPVYVPTGTYLISQIVLDYQHAVLYGNSRKSVLRSINNNTADSIVKFSERGILGSIVRNIYIHGNKENNSNVYDGLLFTSDNEYGDSYALIDNVEVVSCTGNGINLNESKIREIRISNTRSAWNIKNGFRIYKITDSMFYNCTAASNQECGFYIVGSNHKITGCKAHTNGAGDGVTIDQERSPASAYEETEDASPQTGKTYYTRSGSGYNDDPYVFTVFSGSSFTPGTTYYELVKIYLKRYYGFYLEGKENTLSTCEAQDNLGDGYYVNGGNNSLIGVLADNNGRIGHQISYEDVGLEQIYDGVHLEPWGNNNVIGTFANFRQRLDEGLCQRSALCVKSSSGKCNASLIADSQVYDVLVFNQGSANVNYITVNGKEYYDEYDVSRLSLYTGCTLQTKSQASTNYSYLKKKGNRKYLRFVATNTSGFQTSGDYVLCTLPERFRPKNVVTVLGTVSNVKGYNINGTATIVINPNGTIQFRGATIAKNDLVIECEYE